jgi:hypothetical protein
MPQTHPKPERNIYIKKTRLSLTHQELMRQAELLQEACADIDSATLDRAHAAIAEEALFVEMLHNQEIRNQLLEKLLAGETKVSAGAIEAAQILINIVLGEPFD